MASGFATWLAERQGRGLFAGYDPDASFAELERRIADGERGAAIIDRRPTRRPIPLSDLERLFQQLVATLAATDPGQLNRPVALGDIRDAILPYRTSRRALGVDTVEDYDLLLLRLAAGEGGFARTIPEDARARFAREVAGSNPDLSLLRRHADAALTLEGLRVARALAVSDDDRYAPPEPELEPAPVDAPPDDQLLDLEIARTARPPARRPGPPHVPLLRRNAAHRTHGQLLPQLRPESDHPPLPPMSDRGGARLAALRQLRGGAGPALSGYRQPPRTIACLWRLGSAGVTRSKM